MRTRIALIFPLLCAPLAFWACGDDAGNDSNGSESAGCTVSENKDGSYTVSCADGTEAVLHDGEDGNDGTDGKDGSSCTVAVSKDSSTYILICDGKVVGEISDGSDGKDGKDGLDGNDGKNGKDGADGSDGKNGNDGVDGTSCTVADTTDAATGRTGYNLVCDGERKGIVWNGVDGKDAEVPLQSSSSSEHDPEIVEIRNKSISGESQFVAGSTVKLYELDGETCAQTGKSFAGKIINDNGELKISSVTLASQYALLEVSGYYRNVVNGETSSAIITLNALVDLSNREKVNVNMLTHLEYERALYLVRTGMKVSAAKNQAETEILGAFGIEGNFANSEDLNIFGESEESAVLLAISVMMQGGRGAEKLTEFLSKIAIDIEKDGEWNDFSTKAKIADWANEHDLNGGLSSIRSNINSWGLGSAPDFEKYVRNFWYANYGLEACEADSKGVVAAAFNELVKTYGTKTRYICNGEGWVEASDIEKDTYQWAAGEDGEIKLGSVTKSVNYVYDGAKNAWRNASTVEAALGGCTETREADITLNTGKVNGTWYICKNRKWESTNNITVDTQGWVEGSDGDIKKGDSTDVMYKYDEALDKWEEANENDVSLNLGCTTNRTGEIGKSGEDKYYCSSKGWVSLKGGWSWDLPKEACLNPEIDYGEMADPRDGQVYKTVKIGDQVWMAENLNYADSTKTPSLKGGSWCYDNRAENCDVTGRLYTWAAAIDSVALANDADNPQTCGYGETCMLPTVVQGVCPSGWHLPTEDEWETLFAAVGGKGDAGKMLKSTSGWSDSGNGTDAYGFSALPAGGSFHDVDFYSAGNYAYFWSATQGENDSYYAYFMSLRCSYDSPSQDSYLKGSGYSVRCLQN